MNELHLFAGAGGGILGGILLGHTTVCAVEIEPYCREVLLQRQRDGILPKFPNHHPTQAALNRMPRLPAGLSAPSLSCFLIFENAGSIRASDGVPGLGNRVARIAPWWRLLFY